MAFTHSGESEFLEKLTEITEANLANEQFGVSELAREMGMSRSNLHRKVKSASKTSVSQFIRQVRLKKAMELLKQTSSTISEVAFECGFHSVTYFTKCFHDHYGFPPGKAANSEAEKYNLDGVQHHETKPGIRKKQLIIIILCSALSVIIAVFVLFFIFRPFSTKNQSFDKSIAVLPFKSLSDDPEKQYLADGAMDAILLHLSKIEDLRVMARTSVEQYRKTDKTATLICRELDVAYLLEGSFQKYGDQARLIIQLIEPGKEGNIWAKEYDRNWEDIFTVQSEVAQSIARELQAVITPEEKQLIEKVPTTNLTAYDFYQRGFEEHRYYAEVDRNNTQALDKAEVLYQKALDHDSTYAEAYAALAFVNYHKFPINNSENCLDSVLILADIALSYDNQLSNAYLAKGWYHFIKEQINLAIEEFDNALRYDPNNAFGYEGKAWVYWFDNNYVGAIDNFQKMVFYYRGSRLPLWLRRLGQSYNAAGFKEKYQYYLQEAVKLDDDSIAFYIGSALSESYNGNYPKAIENGLKGYSIDSLNTTFISSLGLSYMFDGEIEESLRYFEKYIEIKHALGQFTFNYMSLIGYCYWQNGYEKEAEHYFNEQIKYSEEVIKMNRLFEYPGAYYTLAQVYAFRGEEKKAYENLRNLNQKPRMVFWVPAQLKNDPLFDNIRNEPEFQQILQDVEAKYQEEHERVRKWLEENDML